MESGQLTMYVVQVGGTQAVLGIVMNGLCHEWRFSDLFAATNAKPRVEIAIEDLGVLDSDIWFGATGRRPTLRNIAAEIERIDRVDCAFPAIVITPLGLVDGTHRLVKAHLAGARSLTCVEFSLEELGRLPHVKKTAPPGRFTEQSSGG